MGRINKGDRFGRLTVVETNIKLADKSRKHTWHFCKCDCGKTAIVTEEGLLNNSYISCGCYRKEKAKEQIEINRRIMKDNGKSTFPHKKAMFLTKGNETHTLSEWAKINGISKQALSKRLKKMSVEKALTIRKGERVK